MPKKDNREMFESMPIFKAMMKLALPMVLGQLVSVFYNMADTYFVAKTGDTNQIAAVSLAFPIFGMLMGLGTIFAMGGSSLIARSLGAGDYKRAKATSAFCFYAMLGLSVLITVFSLATLPMLINLIGASDATRGYAYDYLIWIMGGCIFIQMANSLGGLIRAEGAAKQATVGMMIGTVVNMVFDPLMILTFDWGVTGAAIATVLGNVCAAGYYLHYFLKRSPHLSINIKDFAVKGIVGEILKIGIPSCLNNLLMSFSFMFYNNVMSKYGDNTISAMGIVGRVMSLIMMFQGALAMGVGPLIGFNYGARNYRRMKETILKTMACTLTVGLVTGAIYFFFSRQIIGAFIQDEGIISMGVRMVNAQLIAAPLMGVMFSMGGTLQAMGKGFYSLLTSLFRQGIVFLPMLLFLDRNFHLEGVIYAQPVTDICSLLLTGTIVVVTMRKLLRNQTATELADGGPILGGADTLD